MELAEFLIHYASPHTGTVHKPAAYSTEFAGEFSALDAALELHGQRVPCRASREKLVDWAI